MNPFALNKLLSQAQNMDQILLLIHDHVDAFNPVNCATGNGEKIKQ